MKNALRLTSALLCVLMILSAFASAPAFAASPTSGVIGTCRWTFSETSGLFSLYAQGGGEMPDFEHYTTKKWKDSNGETKPSDVPWIELSNKIKKIVVNSGVKYIGKGAFYNCGYSASPIEVYLTGGLSIGPYAFSGAYISKIDLSANIEKIGDHAFYSGYLPASVNINAAEIGDYAFSCVTDPFETVTFSNRTKSIGEGAFQSCTGLRQINFGSNITTVGKYAFAGMKTPYVVYGLQIPETITDIGEKAFGYNSEYKKDWKCVIFTEQNSAADKYAKENGISVEYGKKFYTNYYDSHWTFETAKGIVRIYSYSDADYQDKGYDYRLALPDPNDEYWQKFVNQYGKNVYRAEFLSNSYYGDIHIVSDGLKMLPNLRTVLIDNEKLDEISDGAFKGMTSLYSIEMSDSVKTIGEEAFSGCTSLDSIKIGKNVETIEKNAFSGCSSLEKIEIGKDVSEDVKEFTVESGVFSGCTKLSGAVIGDRMTTIPDSMFEGCKSLSDVVYGDSITSIGNSSFKNCSSLESFAFGKGLRKIGDDAFAGTKLNELFVPEEITEIGEHAFCYKEDNGSYSLADGAMLYVAADSAAQEYAKKNNIPYEINVGGSLGNTCWRFDENTGELFIYGKGEMEEFSSFNAAPWLPYCYKITSIHISGGITSVSRKAFANDFLKLENVYIGKNVRTIGMQAFYNCPLKYVELPFNVSDIRKEAFGYLEDAYGNVTKNEELVMKVSPKSVAEKYAVENDIRREYDNVEGTTGDCKWTYYPGERKLVVYGSGMMEDYDLSYATPWSGLTFDVDEIIIEDGVENIGRKAFAGFETLKKVIIAPSVKTIGEGAFGNTSGLLKLLIPESVTYIGSNAVGFTYSMIDYDDYSGSFNPGFVILCSDESSAAIAYAETNGLTRRAPTDEDMNELFPTEPVTDPPTDPPTEPGTSAPTEKPTDASTQESDTKPTESAEQDPTEAQTQDPAEAPTQEPTEGSAEPQTEATAENPTEAPTQTSPQQEDQTLPAQPGTDIPTQPITEHTSDVPTEAPTEPETQGTTDAPEPAPSLNKTKLSLKAGKTAQLSVVNGVEAGWTSTAEKVFRISGSGKITALKKGRGDAIAILESGVTLRCSVTVKTSPSIKVGKKKFTAKKTYTVKKGKTLSLTITGKAKGVNNTYSSTNKRIAAVTTKKRSVSKLKIKGYRKGKATVTLKVNGVSFKIKVKVK